jgi:alpha-L-fucosidase 2
MRTDIEYAVAGNESLKLDVGIPDGKGPFPIAILVHGGGWRGGDKQVFIKPIFQPLADAGFVWFSINYRLAPAHRYPAAVDDVTTAVRWIKAHASEYKADEKRMALIGESAGGHLVALVGARDGRRLGIAAVVPFYAPCDMEAMTLGEDKTDAAFKAIGSFLGFTEPNDQARRLLRESSPITYVNKDMPPFLLIHGDKDQAVPYNQSVKMRDRMKQAGASCDLYTVEGGGHGMSGWEKDPKLQTYKAEMIRWLKKNLSAK